MVSIVIPAHNEENVIGRCLEHLLADASMTDLNIVVACNGCVDRTAEIARTFGSRVTVLETDVASKTHALNIGDAAATDFPRFYMDADVVLEPQGIREIANVLNSGSILSASPLGKQDFSKSSWLVHAYYDVWRSLPYVKADMIGAGIYALSENGRNRFGEFPNIIADDGYIRLLFAPHERARVANAISIVSPPKAIADLIKINTRSRLGNYQLAQLYPDLLKNDQKKYGGALVSLLCQPVLWPKVPVYLFVNFVARWRARKQYQSLANYRWERDESSRDIK
jgi:glycosyltransferase involved in cell wall biosynthesis